MWKRFHIAYGVSTPALPACQAVATERPGRDATGRGSPWRLTSFRPDDAADEEAAAPEAPDALAAIDTAEDGDARATDKSPGPAA